MKKKITRTLTINLTGFKQKILLHRNFNPTMKSLADFGIVKIHQIIKIKIVFLNQNCENFLFEPSQVGPQ